MSRQVARRPYLHITFSVCIMQHVKHADMSTSLNLPNLAVTAEFNTWIATGSNRSFPLLSSIANASSSSRRLSSQSKLYVGVSGHIAVTEVAHRSRFDIKSSGRVLAPQALLLCQLPNKCELTYLCQSVRGRKFQPIVRICMILALAVIWVSITLRSALDSKFLTLNDFLSPTSLHVHKATHEDRSQSCVA
jgi:hypothetical protein